jgi:hypothetical protein
MSGDGADSISNPEQNTPDNLQRCFEILLAMDGERCRHQRENLSRYSFGDNFVARLKANQKLFALW